MEMDVKHLQDFLWKNGISWDGKFNGYDIGCPLPKITIYYHHEDVYDVYLQVAETCFKLYEEYSRCYSADDPEDDKVILLQDLSQAWTKYALEKGLVDIESVKKSIDFEKKSSTSALDREMAALQKRIAFLKQNHDKDMKAWDEVEVFADSLASKSEKE